MYGVDKRIKKALRGRSAFFKALWELKGRRGAIKPLLDVKGHLRNIINVSQNILYGSERYLSN